MNPIQAAILGFIQGATEFIPVSSSGHLIIIPTLLGWEKPSLTFEVFVHFGTLLALVIYFWPEFVKLVRNLFKNPFEKPLPFDTFYSYLVVLTIIPAALVDLLFNDRLNTLLENPVLASWLLLVTAGFLIIASYLKGTRKLSTVTALDFLVVSLMQAVAILPGISRSGSTITAGRAMGLDRESSAKFAFHIAIPAIGAAFLWHLLKALKGNIPIEWIPSFIGLAVAAIVGYLSLVLFFKIIKKMNFMIFAGYCIALFLLCRYIWR